MRLIRQPLSATALVWLQAIALVRAISLTNSDFNGIQAGKPFKLTWSGDGTPARIILASGDPKDLQPVFTIAQSAKGNSFTYTFPADLPSGDYAFTVSQSGQINYSPKFTVTGGVTLPTDAAGSSSPSSSTSAAIGLPTGLLPGDAALGGLAMALAPGLGALSHPTNSSSSSSSSSLLSNPIKAVEEALASSHPVESTPNLAAAGMGMGPGSPTIGSPLTGEAAALMNQCGPQQTITQISYVTVTPLPEMVANATDIQVHQPTCAQPTTVTSVITVTAQPPPPQTPVVVPQPIPAPPAPVEPSPVKPVPAPQVPAVQDTTEYIHEAPTPAPVAPVPVVHESVPAFVPEISSPPVQTPVEPEPIETPEVLPSHVPVPVIPTSKPYYPIVPTPEPVSPSYPEPPVYVKPSTPSLMPIPSQYYSGCGGNDTNNPNCLAFTGAATYTGPAQNWQWMVMATSLAVGAITYFS